MDRPWIEAGLKYAWVSEHDVPCLLVQRVARLRAKNGLDQQFLRYVIGSRAFTDYVIGVQTGTAVPHISGKQIQAYEFMCPPLDEQRAIARILGTLDDKIELNRRMNATLEAIARALFRSWFVDFDPVRAKAEGRQPVGMDAATAALFPDGFEDSPLGEIPWWWRVADLRDCLAVLETGSRPKGGVKGIEKGVPSIGAESITGLGQFDFGKVKFVPSEYYQSMKRGRIEDRDVLVYKDGGRPGQFEPHTSMFGDGFPFSEACINEHVYRLRAGDVLSQEFVYFWLRTDFAEEEMRIRGTGVAVPGLNSTALGGLRESSRTATRWWDYQRSATRCCQSCCRARCGWPAPSRRSTRC
jgi:type I restriction enzyme S subunit